MSRHKVRRQSLANIPNMDLSAISSLKKRIFQNHEITAASATLESMHAGEESKLAKEKLAEYNGLINNYHGAMGRIVSRLQHRLSTILLE